MAQSAAWPPSVSPTREAVEWSMRQNTLPAETVLSVEPGSKCHIATGLAMMIAGQEVIILARNVAELNIVFNKLNPAATLQARYCPKVAVIHVENVTLDDEL